MEYNSLWRHWQAVFLLYNNILTSFDNTSCPWGSFKQIKGLKSSFVSLKSFSKGPLLLRRASALKISWLVHYCIIVIVVLCLFLYKTNPAVFCFDMLRCPLANDDGNFLELHWNSVNDFCRFKRKITKITHKELKKIVKKVLQLVTQFISKLIAHFSSFSFMLKNVFSLRSDPHDSFFASVDERRRRTSKLIDVFLRNSKVTYARNLYIWVGREYPTDDYLINSQNFWLCCIQQ